MVGRTHIDTWHRQQIVNDIDVIITYGADATAGGNKVERRVIVRVGMIDVDFLLLEEILADVEVAVAGGKMHRYESFAESVDNASVGAAFCQKQSNNIEATDKGRDVQWRTSFGVEVDGGGVLRFNVGIDVLQHKLDDLERAVFDGKM